MNSSLSSVKTAMKSWQGLVFYILLFLAVSYVLGMVTRDNIYPWYENLLKPDLTAPKWAFPVVWPILYVMLAIVIWRVGKLEDSKIRDVAWGHIFLNWGWTPVFFGLHQLGAAFFWLILMLITLFYLGTLLRGRDKTSLYLLIPYSLWLLFATYMSGGIWMLNS